MQTNLYEQAESLAARVWALTETIEDLELRSPLRRRALYSTLSTMEALITDDENTRFFKMQDASFQALELCALLTLARRVGEVDCEDEPEAGYRELYESLNAAMAAADELN